MTNQQKFDRLRKLLDEASVYARAVGKLEFDMQCCAPKDGMEQAGADMAVLSDRHFRLTHTKRYAQLVTELHADSEELTPVQKKVVEHLYEAWEKEKNIPAKLNYEMSLAYNRAYSKWLEAKQAADFSLFRDSLAEIISYTHKALDLRENKKPTYYDALLDDTEKGGSIAQLDAFFDALRADRPAGAAHSGGGQAHPHGFHVPPVPHSAAGGVLQIPAGAGGLKAGRARPHDDRASVHHELRPQGRARHDALL